MATQEKLLKSLGSLKNLLNPNLATDSAVRKKEKIQYCHVITEAISNPTIKIAPNFGQLLGIVIDILLQLCDDQDSNIRMVADECLNRIIRAMSNGNIGKVQVELHKQIKKNGPARSLRGALWRFSQLAHLIRPHKGKLYITNLLPHIIEIVKRPEEQIHETLSNSLPKILSALGAFATDNDIKNLLKALLVNISNDSTVIRRTTATCILTVCLNCRKQFVFITFILNSLIDLIVPVKDTHNSPLILGVLGCLKVILPYLKNTEDDQEIQGSFGVRKEINEIPLATDRLLQVYELCLHYIVNDNHNIVNAALETLNILLLNRHSELNAALLSANGIVKSRIMYFDNTSKMKLRSPSILSVAGTQASDDLFTESELTDTLRPDIEKWIDDSKLTVISLGGANIETESELLNSGRSTASMPNLEHSSNEYSSLNIAQIFSDSCKSQSILENMDKLTLSESSSVKSYKHSSDDKIVGSSELLLQEVSIGDFLDKDISLVYCTRLIAKSFLLNGQSGSLMSDKISRVSVKSLALACLSTIASIYPQVFLKYLDKNCAKSLSANDEKENKQPILDVLLFHNHSDPQLRGAVRFLIASFIKTVLIQSSDNYETWIEKNSLTHNHETVKLENLIEILIQGIQDESSSCSRQSLIGLEMCFENLTESQNCLVIIPVLKIIPLIALNPHWLVKVKLLQFVSDINYVTIHYITDSDDFQTKIINNVLFELLKVDDQRIRTACSNAIINVIPKLYSEHVNNKENCVTYKAMMHRELYLSNLQYEKHDSNITKKHFVQNMPFPFNSIDCEFAKEYEYSLSVIINKLSEYLLTTTSKHLAHGCIETLSLLSEKYPTTVYKKAWSCFKTFNINNDNKKVTISSSADLFGLCVNLINNTIISHDLTYHINLLTLTGNLFTGVSVLNLKPATELNVDKTGEIWDIFIDKIHAELCETFFMHIIKMLNIFYHVVEESTPVLPQNKAVLPNLPAASSLSPIKRRKSDLDKSKLTGNKNMDKDDKEKRSDVIKTNWLGNFPNIPYYMKIFDYLRTAYTNYKITLESEASEKFLDVLKATLKVLAQILELGTLVESGRVAEEILFYLRSIFTLEPTYTVACVQQLLKSLFATNLTANIGEILQPNKESDEEEEFGFYYNISQKPYKNITASIKALQDINKLECDGDSTVMGYLHRRDSKTSGFSRSSDKNLASFIRIFEPMVIKSLKQYTETSNVKLQCRVLDLLSQLVQLRVNYCLLDSEQIFIGFVLKQFEYIEEGQIPLTNELIPKIFNFLVNLSYGKHHSKSIISVPKIIQLCDGLMASGQSPLTHCIPALEPIVEDIFLTRNKSNTTDFKELETTREVLLAMLLRLFEYSEVVDLIVLILNESKYCIDNTEKWLRWSKQVTDVFIPMLKQNKIRLDNPKALKSLKQLIFVLNPEVFIPINDVLTALLQEPPLNDDSILLVNRWLGKNLIILLVILQVKEDILLSKIVENQANFSPYSIYKNIPVVADPLNVTSTSNFFTKLSPEIIFIRYIFRVIEIVVEFCLKKKDDENDFLIEQFSTFLMYCLYIFQSGTHCKIANTAIGVVNKLTEENEIRLDIINENFIELATFYPILTFKWCYFLTLLSYNNRKFWKEIIEINSHTKCINKEIVHVGASIVYCDFLSESLNNKEQLIWLLQSNLKSLICLCDELPVAELFSSIHRNAASSKLVLDVVIKDCIENTDPVFIMKVLKCIENVHPSQTGALLKLLLFNLLNSQQLALSRSVANLASRKIELLLTMTMEEVNNQLIKDDLVFIIENLITSKLAKKHETLLSLLNKLSVHFYDLSPHEIEQRRTVNPEYIKKLQINKSWYLHLLKTHCFNSTNVDMAELLCKLTYEELKEIMNAPEFNKLILKSCIVWGSMCMEKNGLSEEPALLKASVECLLRNIMAVNSSIPKPHQVFKVSDRSPTLSEDKYTESLKESFKDEQFFDSLSKSIPSLTSYIKSLPHLPNIKIPDGNFEDVIKFTVLCLESVNYLVTEKKRLNINFIDSAINCADIVLKESHLCSILALDTHISWLCSAINSIYVLVHYLLLSEKPPKSIPKYNLESTLENLETFSAGHACHQLSVLIVWLESVSDCTNIPIFLLKPIKSIIVSLCRLPLVKSYILIPPTAWKTGWSSEMSGTQVLLLPIDFLQDIDILEEFIFRITLLGWTSRQHFEETWMCLLSVLSATPSSDTVPEEINAITHSMSLAVQALSSLLIQSLFLPHPGNQNVSKLIHIPRDSCIDTKDSTSLIKLKHVQYMLQTKYKESIQKTGNSSRIYTVFEKPNVEKINDDYSFGQVSLEYMLISASIAESEDTNSLGYAVFKQRTKVLEESGLDINSCLQFLLDLYSQWIKSSTPVPLRLLYEMVRSIIMISDLFTEKSQYTWMLEVFFELSKTHTVEDELLHQYLVIGICKSAACLTPDIETYESIKKLLSQYLKSTFLPARIASLHGILYILQGCLLSNTVIGGISEEMQLILPIAVEYVQNQIADSTIRSQDHSLLVWALAFFLIENIDEINMEYSFVSNTLQAVISFLSQPNLSIVSYTAVIKGLERIVVVKKYISDKIRTQILKLALEKMRNSNPNISIPGLQLLLSYMYIEYAEHLDNREKSVVIISNPDHLVQTIEKITAIFDRIKKGYAFEVEIFCTVLPFVLNDFFSPSDILNKVIGEFLSPQQPHPKLLSRVVFKVFESAIKQNQISLLQDWVVFSLPSFTQSYSMGMSTWCLTCFFISASTNEWLRSFFPYIQSRVGRFDYEDRKMLCIAGTDFYKNLVSEKQKETFVRNFQTVKDQIDMPFNDLLASL